MKIRAKLFLFAILCSALPLILAFKLSFNAAKNSLTHTVEQNLHADAYEVLNALQDDLANAKHQLVTFAKIRNMQQVDVFAGNSLQEDLETFQERTPLFADVLATNDNGRVVAASIKEFLHSNLSSTWEYEAPKLGIEFDGRVVQSYRLGKQISTQSVPIYRNGSEHEFIGTLIGSIDWEYPRQRLASYLLFGGAQSERRQVFLEAVSDETILYGTQDVDVPHELFANVEIGDKAKVVERGGQSYVMVTVSSEARGQFRDPQWRLHFLLDTDITYESVESLKNHFLLVAGAVLLLALAVSYFLSRTIVEPVNSLLHGAQQLALGNYSKPLPESGKSDEIAQLTSNFNAMSVAIQDKRVELLRKTEAAEKAALSKSEFLANMSHEIRTPINGVLGMTELLLNTPLNQNQKRYAETISNSGKSLLSVVNDILDFSKIEAGKLELAESAFDLRELVEDALSLLAESAHRKKVELYLNIPPDFEVAYNGDLNRLRQILLNLLGNAIKFTEKGEIQLAISEVPEDGVDRIKFSVIDTGIGIPEEQLQSIFESFVQADGTSTRQFGGTGLGLSISSKLAQLMGGEIGVESALGEGSTFWFTAELEKLPSSVEAVWRRKDSLVGKRILVVDDNVTNCEILHEQLLYWGAIPDSVEDGSAALEKLSAIKKQSLHYDAAILDMQMPQMNGLELARNIKQESLAINTRIVLLSSACDQIDPEQYHKAGIHCFTAKPVRQPDLYNSLTAAISSSKGIDAEQRKVAKQFQHNSLSGSVLLAEDNIVNQDMMMELLGQLGVRATLAENGQQVLDLLEDNTFDLVLMDCQMPVLDGFAATKKIRESEAAGDSCERLPIVALTANAMEGYRDKCIDAGMDEYLSKPVSSSSLVDMLGRWLQRESVESVETYAQQNQRLHPGSDADLPNNNDEEEPPKNVFLIGAGSDRPSEEEVVLDELVFAELMTMCDQATAGFYDRLLQKYELSASEDIACLREAIDNADAEQVGSCAHRLKSSSANWGAKRMAKACQHLEMAGKGNQLAAADSLLSEIEQQLSVLVVLLNSRKSRAA